MIYKVLAIQYYPSGLGTSYECIVNDEKQTDVTTAMNSARVYLYDISNAQNTSVNNNNTVSIYANRTSGSIALSGYSYTTNNVTTFQTLNNVTSTTVNISNLRDPGADITFYGGGSGSITVTGADKSVKVEGGRTFRIRASYSVSASIFSYPNNNYVTITVTPTYTGSGDGLDAPNYWTHYWNVNFNGIAQGNYSISGNGNTGAGSFTFKCPYDTKWTVDSPKIEVYCSRIEALYSYQGGGQTVTIEYFHLNNQYQGGATGEALTENESFIDYDFIYEGDYRIKRNNGGSVIVYCSGETSSGVPYSLARINSSYGYIYEETHQEGGTTYSGYITYYA